MEEARLAAAAAEAKQQELREELKSTEARIRQQDLEAASVAIELTPEPERDPATAKRLYDPRKFARSETSAYLGGNKPKPESKAGHGGYAPQKLKR